MRSNIPIARRWTPSESSFMSIYYSRQCGGGSTYLQNYQLLNSSPQLGRIFSIFGRISGYMAEWIPSGWVGAAGGRKETAISEPTYPQVRITKICTWPSSLFESNLVIKFGSEDLQNQDRVRPPPSERAFRADADIPVTHVTAGLLAFLLQSNNV